MPIFKRSKKKDDIQAPRPAQELLEEEPLAAGHVEEMVRESEFIIPAPKDVLLSTGSDEEMTLSPEEEVIQMPEEVLGEAVIEMGPISDDLEDLPFEGEIEGEESVQNIDNEISRNMPPPERDPESPFPDLSDVALDNSLQEAIEESLIDLRSEEEALEKEKELRTEEAVQEEPFSGESDVEKEKSDQVSKEILSLQEEVDYLQEAKESLAKDKLFLEEELAALEQRLLSSEESFNEKSVIDKERIDSLEKQIEDLTTSSEEDEKRRDAHMRQRIEGLIRDLTPDGSDNPDFSKLNTLLQSVEEYHDFLRAEKERMETLHSLAEMELQRAREQTLEAEKSKKMLEEEREDIANLRSDLEREAEVVQAEKEKIQLEGVETTRVLTAAREQERRTGSELQEAQKARDLAKDAKREADLLKRKVEIDAEEVASKKNELEVQQKRVEDLEKSVQERNQIAEEQRNYSSDILENLTQMRRALERSRSEVEDQQEHLRNERSFYEQERLETEKKKEEYENGIADLTESRKGVVEELERARQTRQEAEREREVLSGELRDKIHAAGEELKEAKEELSDMHNKLEKAERDLSESERERHELRAEVHRLKSLAEDGEIGKQEAKELRQWVSRARQLEEELQKIQGRAPTEDDAVELASRAIHDIGDAALAIQGGDPVKRAELQRLLTDLMGVATREENLVSKTVTRAKELIQELQEEESGQTSANPVSPQTSVANPVSPQTPVGEEGVSFEENNTQESSSDQLDPFPGVKEESLPADIHADPVLPEEELGA